MIERNEKHCGSFSAQTSARPIDEAQVEKFLSEFASFSNDFSILVSEIEIHIIRFAGDFRTPEKQNPDAPCPTDQFFRITNQLNVCRNVLGRLSEVEKITRKYF